MSFWKKKLTKLNSDEYEQISKKLVGIVCDLDGVLNRVALLDTMVKGNRMKLTKLSNEKMFEDTEKDLNDGPKYI